MVLCDEGLDGVRRLDLVGAGQQRPLHHADPVPVRGRLEVGEPPLRPNVVEEDLVGAVERPRLGDAVVVVVGEEAANEVGGRRPHVPHARLVRAELVAFAILTILKGNDHVADGTALPIFGGAQLRVEQLADRDRGHHILAKVVGDAHHYVLVHARGGDVEDEADVLVHAVREAHLQLGVSEDARADLATPRSAQAPQGAPRRQRDLGAPGHGVLELFVFAVHA